MEFVFKGMNEDVSECSLNELDIQRCPFLRNINKPTCFSFPTANFPFLVRGAKGPIFEDGPSFDTTFKLFHGKDGVVPLSERSDFPNNLSQPKTTPQFNPLAAKAATISLSAFGPGGPFSFGDFSEKWKKQKSESSNKRDPSSQRGSQSKHEASGNEWLETGNCPIAKSFRAVGRVLPLIATALQPPPGMKYRCPPAIVAARAALARTAFVKNLRPQPLPEKMLVIAALGMAANVPLGVWREHTQKFSLSWFVAVHAAVPLIAMLRKSVLMPKTAMVMTIAASILGQVIGSRAERLRLKAIAEKGQAMVESPTPNTSCVKKSPASSLLKTDKVQSSPKIQARKKPTNDKSVLQANGKSREKNAEDSKKQKEKNISKEEHIQKSEEAHTSQNDISELKSSLQEKKNVEKGGHSDKSLNNQKHREKDNVEKSPRENKNKENFGGLIFMCSTKTKPDCLHYNVMGVSASKKDSVLAIKPGIKLFLYDFDLRLLYGIYKASSSGGMKLEPKAFNGAFPAQVRFKIYKDCFPLPENVFKKAIKENFYEKHKFRAELTAEQVRKLSDLFRPIGIHSSSATVRSSPRAPIRDRKARGGVKEVRTRNPKSEGDGKNYHSSSRKRDREVPYREEVPRHREEASSRDLYLSEKEYRTYGLRAERRNLDSVPYHRDYDRDYHLRLPESSYRDVVPAQRELVRADHVYFNGKDYPVYTIDPRPELSPPKAIPSGSERNTYDPYYNRQYVPPVDPYLLPSRREERVPPNYSGRNYVVDTEPVRHAVDALSYYNQTHHTKLESDTMPVSSRYSFAGPSYTYR